MKGGRANWLMIALAAVAGGIVALSVRGGSASRERGSEPAAEPAAPPRAASTVHSALAGSAPAPQNDLEATPGPSGGGASATSTSGVGGTAGAATSTGGVRVDSLTNGGGAGGAPGHAPAFQFAVPTSREELRDIEVRCQRKSPEDCESAARSLEEGNVVPQDIRRATMLRRIALTLYVKQCEGDRALACSRLAEMHEVGDFVQKNAAHAKALRKRAVELCRQKPEQAGCAS